MIWVVVLGKRAMWVLMAMSEKGEKRKETSLTKRYETWDSLIGLPCHADDKLEQVSLDTSLFPLFSTSSSKLLHQQRTEFLAIIPSLVFECCNFYF